MCQSDFVASRFASANQQAKPLRGRVMSRGQRVIARPVVARPIESDGLCGAVNLVDTGRIAGWAHDKTQPDVRVQLKILIAGKVVAHVVANLYREELYRNGFGDGKHGFEAGLPDRLGGTRVLEVRRAEDGAIIDTWPSGVRGWALPSLDNEASAATERDIQRDGFVHTSSFTGAMLACKRTID